MQLWIRGLFRTGVGNFLLGGRNGPFQSNSGQESIARKIVHLNIVKKVLVIPTAFNIHYEHVCKDTKITLLMTSDFITASRTALGLTQPPTQGVPGALSVEVKRPGREADHSPTSSAEVKECVELYLHSPNTPSCRGAQLKHRDNFTFTLWDLTREPSLFLRMVWWRRNTKCVINIPYLWMYSIKLSLP
jgi:hypothetical protein